jgi:hypothetical protein
MEITSFLWSFSALSVCFLTSEEKIVAASTRIVIPAKAGIQLFEAFWMPDQVRHDGLTEFMDRY